MGTVAHENRKHALLSASGASRWINCTPSARLEDKFEQSKPSVYAQEGTLAHEMADLILQRITLKITESVFKKEFKKLENQIIKFFGGNENELSGMKDHVGKYVELVIESYDAARAETPGAIISIEERVDFSHIVPDGFGTNDVAIIANGVLEIIDLKYGKGIRVDAEDNPQPRLYGIGALQKYEMLYDIHTVKMTIIQPRLDHYSSIEMSVEDLEKWGEKEVKPRAKKAHEGKGVQKAGSWCKFCRVKAMCATLAAQNIKLAKHEFSDPHLMKDSQLLEVYGQIPMLVDWANAVGKYLLDEAIKGKDWPGYKVVEGRSNRKWTNEHKVIKALEDLGKDPDSYLIEKLAGITTIEKLMGKIDFNNRLGKLVEKPQGKPTLVLESDKRPAMGIEQAKEDFS